MKKDETPQDNSALDKFTREVVYAVDTEGNYTTVLSTGWDVKSAALGAAWDDIAGRIQNAKEKVLAGEVSPLLFFMEYRLMDLSMLSAYTGFWKWQIKRHLRANIFSHLSEAKLLKYATAFNVTLEDLASMTIHED